MPPQSGHSSLTFRLGCEILLGLGKVPIGGRLGAGGGSGRGRASVSKSILVEFLEG